MQAEKKKLDRNKKVIYIVWGIFGIPVVLLTIIIALISVGWLGFMPTIEELENPHTSLATEIIASDGEIIGTFFKENRIGVF